MIFKLDTYLTGKWEAIRGLKFKSGWLVAAGAAAGGARAGGAGGAGAEGRLRAEHSSRDPRQAGVPSQAGNWITMQYMPMIK